MHQIPGVIFFFFGYWISLSLPNSSVTHTSLFCALPSLVVYAPRALSPRLCRERIPIARACLSYEPGSVMCNRASLSCVEGSLYRMHCAPVVRAWPDLSRTPDLVCCARIAFARPALSWVTELSVVASYVATKILPILANSITT